MAEGVEVRHQTKCRKRESKKARCNCQPSYRATAYDERQGKQIKRPWTKDKGRAESERIDLMRAIAQGQPVVAGAPTLATYASEVFLPGIQSGAIRNKNGDPYKPGVIRSIRTSFNKHLLEAPEIGNKRLHMIQRKDVQAVVDRLCAEGYAGWTVRNVTNALRSMYRYAVQREVVTHNPTQNLDLPSGARRKVVFESTGEKGEMVIRSAEEVIAMIEALPEHMQQPFATAALGGLTRSELQALRIGHIDFEERLIRVRLGYDEIDRVEQSLKTDGRRRDVPISKYLLPYLAAAVAACGLDAKKDEHVFRAKRGGRIDMTEYVPDCAAIWTEKGITPLGLHDARHTCASMLIRSGADMKQISRIMGHSSIQVTYDVYGHLMPDSLSEATAKLDAYLDRVLAA